MARVLKEILIVIFITSFATVAQAAALHGAIYEWSDFEKPLRNTIVEVNSTPAQYIISTTGTYSFNLTPGSYLIRAKYYRNNILEYIAEDEIQIDKEGDFIHDLLLFPPTDSEYEYLGDINLTSEMETKNEDDLSLYIVSILVIIISASVILYLIKKKSRANAKTINETTVTKTTINDLPERPEKSEATEKPEILAETKNRVLPEDLHTLYDIILKTGGRTTQKELRKKLIYSEAKVSLMLDDLEDRGLIKKIKKGRSNIIIAETQK